jgi:hypothetical protein
MWLPAVRAIPFASQRRSQVLSLGRGPVQGGASAAEWRPYTTTTARRRQPQKDQTNRESGPRPPDIQRNGGHPRKGEPKINNEPTYPQDHKLSTTTSNLDPSDDFPR